MGNNVCLQQSQIASQSSVTTILLCNHSTRTYQALQAFHGDQALVGVTYIVIQQHFYKGHKITYVLGVACIMIQQHFYEGHKIFLCFHWLIIVS